MAESGAFSETAEALSDLLEAAADTATLRLVFPRDAGDPGRERHRAPDTAELRLTAGTWVLGRRGLLPRGTDEEQGIAAVLRADATLSTQHATLRVTRTRRGARRPEVSIVDGARREDGAWRASRNGTWVNGAQVVGERALADGDVLRVGASLFVLRFVCAEATASATTESTAERILGESAATRALRARVAEALDDMRRHAGPSPSSLLLCAETGAGKGVVAKWLADELGGPFVHVNCSALPESLVAAELFGVDANVATGVQARPGLLRSAHGGVVFLDELGSLPLAQQGALLLFLDDGTLLPVGARDASRRRSVSVVVLAATNEDLDGMASEGRFRRDLIERFGARITIPPLRERAEDVLYLLDRFAESEGGLTGRLTPDSAEALVCYPWPGNIRELRRVAAQLSASSGARLALGMLPPAIAESRGQPREAEESESSRKATASRETPTADSLRALLRRHRGNVSALERETGWSRRQLYRYLQQFELEPADFRGDG